MRVLYDTSEVHALDRFGYFRSAAIGEFAPVAIGDQVPGRLYVAMAVDQVGDLMVEVFDWESDRPIEARRTPRLIRASDPDCFRLLLSVHGGMRMRQGDHVVSFQPGDIALYDTSRPFDTRHLPSTSTTRRVVMVTFPRSLVSGDADQIDRHVGTVFPRCTRGRGQLADLLAGLTHPQHWLIDHGDAAEVLRDCVIGLLRERIGRPGITTRTYRQIQQAWIRTVIQNQLEQPTLAPAQIARMAHLSPRSLYQILHDAGTTPMELVKQLRLEQGRRSLTDPAQSNRTIKDIALSLGYSRPDQFAHDFKQMFGVSARTIRRTGNRRLVR